MHSLHPSNASLMKDLKGAEMNEDLKFFLIMLGAVIVAGLILRYGKDMPLLEQSGEGFGN